MRSVLLFVFASCGVHRAQVRTYEDGSDPEAWEALGDAYRKSLRHTAAADAYRMAMDLDPSRTYLAARMSSRTSREAKQLRRQAMRSPADDELWGDLGDILRMEGDLQGARQAYLRAWRLDQEDSEWQRGLVELGDAEMLVSFFAQRLDESDDESLGDYADLLMQAGRRDEACESYRRAAEIDPYDDEWIGHATECGYPVPEGYEAAPTDTGYASYAEEVYEGVPDASDLDSLVARVNADGGLLVKLGQAYLASGDRAKAEETLWAALLVAHTSEEALQSYLLVTGKTRREVLERLRDTFSDDDELVGLLADHYLDLGLRDRARDLYELAHSLDADDPEWEAKRRLLEAARP